MTTSQSQHVTLAANTESHLTWAEWFDTIVITNLGAGNIWVMTDGTVQTATAQNGAIVVPVGMPVVLQNTQAKAYWGTVGAGGTVPGVGKTVQQSQNGTDLPASGFGTFVSLIAGATPIVIVEPQ